MLKHDVYYNRLHIWTHGTCHVQLSEVPGPASVTGGDGEEATPVPISNTEVKLFSVDGTAWETVWESRTPPVLF